MLAVADSAQVEPVGSELLAGTSSPPMVSVIVPTYNEAGNILLLLGRLQSVLDQGDRATANRPSTADRRRNRGYEIIVVDDDSDDGTADLVELHAGPDRRIRTVRRRHDRGLSSAVLAGMGEAQGRILVVMDADLQHDESKLPELVAAVADGRADIAVGSRHVDGGGFGPFGRRRRLMSWAGTVLAQSLLGVTTTDPMSGFFAISRRHFIDVADQIDPRGFKILLEFLVRGPDATVVEVGYQFSSRHSGTTKLTGAIGLAYLRALIDLSLARRRQSRSGRG